MKRYIFEAKAWVHVTADSEEKARLIATGLDREGAISGRVQLAIHDSNLTLLRAVDPPFAMHDWIGVKPEGDPR